MADQAEIFEVRGRLTVPTIDLSMGSLCGTLIVIKDDKGQPLGQFRIPTTQIRYVLRECNNLDPEAEDAQVAVFYQKNIFGKPKNVYLALLKKGWVHRPK